MGFKRRPPKNNVRRVRTNGKNNRGVFVNQAGESTQYESDMEKVLGLMLMRNRRYKRIVSQPLKVPYVDSENKYHEYTPDYMAEIIDGSIEIHEFSLSFRRAIKTIQDRERAADKYCESHGWKYIVHTDLDLPSPIERENIKVLSGFRAKVYSNSTIARVTTEILGNTEKILFVSLVNELVSKLGLQRNLIHGTLLHMMWLDNICTDLTKPIIVEGEPNRKMQVWLHVH